VGERSCPALFPCDGDFNVTGHPSERASPFAASTPFGQAFEQRSRCGHLHSAGLRSAAPTSRPDNPNGIEGFVQITFDLGACD
jgi:hypothetical protein